MKGADIPFGQVWTVTISGGGEYTFEESGNTVAYLDFSDHHQALKLNQTRTRTLRSMFGDDASQYIGKQIGLRQGQPFKGQPSIDIVPPPAAPAPSNRTGNRPAAAGNRAPVTPPPSREYSDAEAPAEEAMPF